MSVPLIELWTGRLPLATAFWTYGVFWSVLVNLTATATSLAVLVVTGSEGNAQDWAPLLAVTLHLLPLPYNLMVLVGVWRSAGRPDVPATWCVLARSTIILWTSVLVLI